MNCRKGTIIEYETTDKMILYSFRLNNEEYCEFDRFILRFDKEPADEPQKRQKKDYQMIISAIEQIQKRGARAERFRGEDNVDALPGQQSDLRLYCIKLHENAVLLGNGGIKTSQKLKDSPDCYPHQQLLAELEKQITERVQSKEIWWQNGKMEGDKYFELGDCE